MVRCEVGKKRNIYFVSSVIKQLVQMNADKFKVSRYHGALHTLLFTVFSSSSCVLCLVLLLCFDAVLW